MNAQDAEALARWAGSAFVDAISAATGGNLLDWGLNLGGRPNGDREAVLHDAIGRVMQRARDASFTPEAIAVLRVLLEENWEVRIDGQGGVVARDDGSRGTGDGCAAADGQGSEGGPDEGDPDGPGRPVLGARVAASDGAVRDAGGQAVRALGGGDVAGGPGDAGRHGRAAGAVNGGGSCP